VLWTIGCLDSLGLPAVAIVGSRGGSPYALAVAERLAGDLAARGVAVISGLARGVDAAAHRGAIAASGATIAVVGCGADVIYPPEHAKLCGEIAGKGAILSELIPGTGPRAIFFPRRNRIISGLARAVVVVEAGERSGSLITARTALEQGRDVFAVPGNVLSGRNRGGHALLRDGAKIVEDADDIFEELQLAVVADGRPPSPENPHAETTRAGSHPVLESLAAGDACNLDEMVARSGLSAAQLLRQLMELELQGSIRRLVGGRFVRS
jgi:DNA processing protein